MDGGLENREAFASLGDGLALFAGLLHVFGGDGFLERPLLVEVPANLKNEWPPVVKHGRARKFILEEEWEWVEEK